MKTTVILTAVMLLLGTPSTHAEAWDRDDLIWQGAVLTTLAIDVYQTRRIVADCRENNPVIGQCGENIPYLAYFAGVALAHTAVVRIVPERYARVIQGVTIVLQIAMIRRNWGAGYSIEF